MSRDDFEALRAGRALPWTGDRAHRFRRETLGDVRASAAGEPVARIAIVEPSEEVARLLAAVVTHLGHEPALARGPDDLPRDCDVLLVEPATPAGLAAARALRAARPDVPIVCVSIHSLRSLRPEVAALEPDAYLVKPFGLTELTSALRGAVEQAGGSSGR